MNSTSSAVSKVNSVAGLAASIGIHEDFGIINVINFDLVNAKSLSNNSIDSIIAAIETELALEDYTITESGSYEDQQNFYRIVWQKNVALINTNYAKYVFNESYNINAQYTSAHGGESFNFYPDEDNDNVKFKWSGVKVVGVKNTYSMANGSKSGTINDF